MLFMVFIFKICCLSLPKILIKYFMLLNYFLNNEKFVFYMFIFGTGYHLKWWSSFSL